MNARTGDYTRHINDDILKTYYFTFKPRPLLDGSFYAFDEELVARLTEAHRILGALSGVVSVMPGREHFAEIMCLKESCCSRMIDYTEPNLFDAMIANGLGTPNECIQSIASAYDHNVKKRFAHFIFVGYCHTCTLWQEQQKASPSPHKAHVSLPFKCKLPTVQSNSAGAYFIFA